MRRRRSAFTLIEILVCLMLLSMAGSLLIYKGGKLLKERRFSSSCEKISSEIAVTKNLALTYQIDIDLVLEQKKGKIYLTRKTDFAPQSIRGLFQGETAFPEVVFGKEDEKKNLIFFGNGWIEGEEKVTLCMASHLKKQYSVQIKHSFRKAI
jgi:prepilin-type N-terminal cleavage/methylation domain-containing protein